MNPLAIYISTFRATGACAVRQNTETKRGRECEQLEWSGIVFHSLTQSYKYKTAEWQEGKNSCLSNKKNYIYIYINKKNTIVA